jgi:hypothetical protein
MGVRDQLGTDKRTISLEMGLLFRKLIQVVGVILDIPIGRNETPPGPAAGSCTTSPGCGLIIRTMQSISLRGVKYWPAPDFLSSAFFCNRPS